MGFVGTRSPFQGSYETPILDVNFGVGNRLQLKYEVPWSVEETRGTPGSVIGGLGNSMLGVKYRFFQRHSKTHYSEGEREIKYALSLYPQVLLNHPDRSVERGVAEPAPQMLLPLEASVNIGWLRASGEIGYWFTSKDAPNSWIFGVVLGHEFKKDTELYLELYDQREVRAPGQNLRESTVGIGGRVPIVRGQWLRLIGMVGHGISVSTPTNGQPTWIAYVGLQFLSDRKRRHLDQ